MRECGRAGAPASLGSPKEVTKGGGGWQWASLPPTGEQQVAAEADNPPHPFPCPPQATSQGFPNEKILRPS